jgi:hypothetical protein
MIKSTMFYVRKQQLWDPTCRVFLMLTGDDQLETQFGRVRMRGAHDTNCDMKSLADQICTAMDPNWVFTWHPSWDQGHRQLNYSRIEHADHLHPHSWKGDIEVGHCDLVMAWAAGHKHAENILKQSHIQVNFNKIFSNPRIDMSHPLPDGKFPGVCDSLDRSMPLPKARTNAVPMERLDIDEDTLGDNKITTAEILDDLPDLLQYFEEPNELMGGEDPEKEDKTASDWLSIDGFQIHMSSAIQCLFTSDLSKKS